ncbi:MAG: CocE/NonD family hydrolase [Promethearchaeota archaeon]
MIALIAIINLIFEETNFLKELMLFMNLQFDYLFESTIYIAIFGRIVYIISYLLFIKVGLKGRLDLTSNNIERMRNGRGGDLELAEGLGDNNNNNNGYNKNLKKLEKVKFWTKFSLNQLLLFGISLLFDFVAVGMTAYSLLLSSQLLRSKFPKSHRFLKILGYLFSPFLYILGGLVLVLGAANILGSGNYLMDLLGFIGGSILFLILRRKKIGKLNSFRDYINYLQRTYWYKIPKKIRVVIIFIIVFTPTFLIGLSYYLYAPRYETIMLEMSDGVKLRTRIYFPSNWDGSPKPVILSRTPYNLEGLQGYVSNYVGNQGFIMVTQDLRGTYGSEGEFRGFITDFRDGNETVNWIMAQPWCNGRIASVGGSALAINQICYHPSLKNPANLGLRAASIIVGTSELYEYGFFMGGCLRQGIAENWLIPVSGLSDSIDYILQHEKKDWFWDNISLERNDRYKNVDVRALHLGGWYDMFCQGTIDTFLLYNNGIDYAKDHQFLVMGPWSHFLSYDHLDISYPNTNNIGLYYYYYLESLLFDEYLNNNTSAIDWATIPRVYYYVMGDPNGIGSGVEYNIWKTANNWPIPYTLDYWYLHPNGTLLNSTPSSGSLKSYIYDPRNPVLNGGGTTLSLQYIGAVDQRRVEYTEPFGTTPRSDILKFDTPVLSSPVEIVGNITAELYITSNCTDTDFMVKLIDVYPDGKEIWVAEGQLKARYRDYPDFTNSSLLAGDGKTIYKLLIDMWSTAYRFVPGHKIRISITSSNWNKFAINPNTGGPIENTHPSDCTQMGVNFNIANNSIACGISGNLSRIWFPRIY